MAGAHPFFDTDSFPMSRDEARDFFQALYTIVRDPAAIELFYLGAGPGLDPLNLGQGPKQIWKQALEALAAARRLRALCDLLLADMTILAIHDRIQAVVDATGAFEETEVSPGCIFVNRTDLREKLKTLSLSATPGVLLIRGESRAGNSWTEKLVRAVAEGYGAEANYIYAGLVSNLNNVVKSLFNMVGEPGYIEPPDESSETAWYTNVCLSLWGFAKKSGKIYWVVADDLSSPEGPRLDAEIKRFFDQFAAMMGGTQIARHFRLVLINYPPGAVPTKWKDEIWLEDNPTLAEFNDAALADFVQKSAVAQGKQMSLQEAERTAGEVLAAVADADKAVRLRTMNAELRRRVGEL